MMIDCVFFLTLTDFFSSTGNSLSAQEIKASKRKMKLNNRMKDMIREVCIYTTFLLLLILVINPNQDRNAYLQNADLTKTYTSNMSKVFRDHSRLFVYPLWSSQEMLSRSKLVAIGRLTCTTCDTKGSAHYTCVRHSIYPLETLTNAGRTDLLIRNDRRK